MKLVIEINETKTPVPESPEHFILVYETSCVIPKPEGMSEEQMNETLKESPLREFGVLLDMFITSMIKMAIGGEPTHEAIGLDPEIFEEARKEGMEKALLQIEESKFPTKDKTFIN